MSEKKKQDLFSRLPADLAAGEQWLFKTAQEARYTPSTLAGLSPEREAHERACAVFAIRVICRHLKLHDLTAASAALFLHRFYMKESLKEYPWKIMIASALFLATKVEEELRKLRDLVQVYATWLHAVDPETKKAPGAKVKGSDESSPEYTKLRDQLLYYEEVLLDALCYDLSVEHPHTYVLRGAELLYEDPNADAASIKKAFTDREEGAIDEEAASAVEDRVEKLRRAAWTVASDSFMTNLCVLHSPKKIAAMALLVASRMIEQPLPINVPGPIQVPSKPKTSSKGRAPQKVEPVVAKPEWWKQFGITLQELEDGAAVIVARYALSSNEYIAGQAKRLAGFERAGTPPPPNRPPQNRPPASAPIEISAAVVAAKKSPTIQLEPAKAERSNLMSPQTSVNVASPSTERVKSSSSKPTADELNSELMRSKGPATDRGKELAEAPPLQEEASAGAMDVVKADEPMLPVLPAQEAATEVTAQSISVEAPDTVSQPGPVVRKESQAPPRNSIFEALAKANEGDQPVSDGFQETAQQKRARKKKENDEKRMREKSMGSMLTPRDQPSNSQSGQNPSTSALASSFLGTIPSAPSTEPALDQSSAMLVDEPAPSTADASTSVEVPQPTSIPLKEAPVLEMPATEMSAEAGGSTMDVDEPAVPSTLPTPQIAAAQDVLHAEERARVADGDKKNEEMLSGS